LRLIVLLHPQLALEVRLIPQDLSEDGLGLVAAHVPVLDFVAVGASVT
jgi:hypothetical protein